MVSSGRIRDHIGDCVTALANINRTFERQRRSFANIQRPDRKDTCTRIVAALRESPVGCSRRKTCRQEVDQRNIGRLSGAIVGDFDQEGNDIAFGRCAVGTGECFDGDQVSFIIDDDFFFKIITGSTRIRLIARSRSRDIGDRVATLPYINGTFQGQRRGFASAQCADRKDPGTRIVAALRNVTVGTSRGQTRRQQIRQRNVSRLSGTIVGDFDLKSNDVAFGWRAVAAGQSFDGHQISVWIDINGFFKIVTGSTRIILITLGCGRDVGDRVATLAHINCTFQSQCCGVANVQCSDRKDARIRVVGSLCDCT